MSKAWDLEVANRFREKIAGNGDDTVVLIHRKTYVQLQQHYDKLEKHKSIASAAQPNNPCHDRLQHALRQTRREMPPTQEAIHCAAIECPVGRPQFGNPAVLNQGISAAAVQHHATPVATNAHFVLRPTPTPVANSRMLLGKGFRSKKHCWRCGFTRREHESGNYGNKCRDNVGREERSWCGWRLDVHADPNKVGPRCPREPKSEQTRTDWYPNSTQRVSTTCGF